MRRLLPALRACAALPLALLPGATKAEQVTMSIEKILSGKSFYTDTSPFSAITTNGWEYFGPHGDWQGIGARAAYSGQYTIKAGKICVEYPAGTTFCRQYKITADAKILLRRNRAEGWREARLKPE